jgi:hypothetical protein
MTLPELRTFYPQTRFGYLMKDARNEETGKGYFVINSLLVHELPVGSYEYVSSSKYWIVNANGRDVPASAGVVARNIATNDLYCLIDITTN